MFYFVWVVIQDMSTPDFHPIVNHLPSVDSGGRVWALILGHDSDGLAIHSVSAGRPS
jgi:hypothetical protein